MTSSKPPSLQVICSLLQDSEYLQNEDIEDDLAGEKETLPDLTAADDIPALVPSISSLWREAVVGASKGITDRTDGEYQRLIKQCATYLVTNRYINAAEDFFSKRPPKDSPFFIISWIMSECDEIEPLNGTKKPSELKRGSYSHAQKLRATMTHVFGRTLGLGSASWTENPETGVLSGNPSVSQQVSAYMISLHNRKAHAGEIPTSARAITSNVLQKLYDFNHIAENWALRDYEPKRRDQADQLDQWGGPMARRELQAIYTIAFLCLLRSDEVLKVKREHIVFSRDPDTITLTLPFRKTHQNGGIKPFVLHAMPVEEAHLCPVRAMADWIGASRITSGYIFRKIASGDRPSAQEETSMTSEQFLEMFRNNLLDITIDPTPYGTHSFCRGGCQYLSSERRWGLRRICEWGGWSTEFSNLTIVRYLISWNDNPIEKREDFFDPLRLPAVRCFTCGRSCHCA